MAPARADSGVTGGLVALAAALVVAVAVGLTWRATSGKMRPAPAAARPAQAGPAPEPADKDIMTLDAVTAGTTALDVATGAEPPETAAQGRTPGRVTAADIGQPLGAGATLLQFSSAFCAPCRATRVILADVARQAPGVAHVEIDAESHLDLVRALGVLRTPTVFVLGADGAITARASGQPRKADVLGALGAALPAGSTYSPGRE
jgi:thiol-disulfide isomerase/thioredoxin